MRRSQLYPTLQSLKWLPSVEEDVVAEVEVPKVEEVEVPEVEEEIEWTRRPSSEWSTVRKPTQGYQASGSSSWGLDRLSDAFQVGP